MTPTAIKDKAQYAPEEYEKVHHKLNIGGRDNLSFDDIAIIDEALRRCAEPTAPQCDEET